MARLPREGARGLVHTTEGDQQLVPLIVRTSLSILRHKRAMGSRSHLVGKGAMREHLAYQSSVRRSAAAGAEARAASGMPKPCKACAGKHVARLSLCSMSCPDFEMTTGPLRS